MRVLMFSGIRANTPSMVAPALYAGINTKTFSTMNCDGSDFPLAVILDVSLHRRFDRIADAPPGFPTEQCPGLVDVWYAPSGIVVPFAAKLVAGDVHDVR